MTEFDLQFWRDRPALVTGATGFVGSHLVTELVGLGAQVVVLQRDTTPANDIVAAWKEAVTFVDGAVEDQAVLERAMGEHEIRTVFHLAAQSQVGVANRNPVSTFEANIQGTWCLLEAARRTSTVDGIVIASSDKAYGTHTDLPYDETLPLLAVHPYDVSKACADMLAACYGETFEQPVAITRCGNFFGPGDANWARLVPGTIRSLVRGEAPVIRSDGTMTRDYIYARDGVQAYLLLAERLPNDPALRGQAFNFSLERPLSVLDLVEVIQGALGTSIEPVVLNQATNEIPHQWLSAARARKELGWTPGWTLESAMAETVAWYRNLLTA